MTRRIYMSVSADEWLWGFDLPHSGDGNRIEFIGASVCLDVLLDEVSFDRKVTELLAHYRRDQKRRRLIYALRHPISFIRSRWRSWV